MRVIKKKNIKVVFKNQFKKICLKKKIKKNDR